MGWKVYSWAFTLIIGAIEFLGIGYSLDILLPEEGDLYFDQPWMWKDWLYLPVFGISVMGLFGFAYQKAIGGKSFWENFFIFLIIVEIIDTLHEYNIGNFEQQEVLYPVFTFFFFIAIFLPYFIALFLYGFKSDSLWNPQPDPLQ